MALIFLPNFLARQKLTDSDNEIKGANAYCNQAIERNKVITFCICIYLCYSDGCLQPVRPLAHDDNQTTDARQGQATGFECTGAQTCASGSKIDQPHTTDVTEAVKPRFISEQTGTVTYLRKLLNQAIYI